MPSAEDLTGMVFGKLHVEQFVGRVPYGDRPRRSYRCKCECGGEKVVCGDALKRGVVSSCGCLRWLAGNKSPKWVGHGEISGNYWDHVKRGAKSRGFEFSVSIEDAWALFEKQERRCAISGLPLSFESQQKRRSVFGTASFDRIDSRKGYVEGNVQWVHKDVNRMKQHFNESYFIEMCGVISEHQKGRT